MRTIAIAAVTAAVVVGLYAAFLAPRAEEPQPVTGVSAEYSDLARRVRALEQDVAARDAAPPPRLQGAADAARANEQALAARLAPLEARLEALERGAEGAQQEPASSAPASAEDGARKKELDHWVERLGNENENIAFAATLELGRLKDARAVPALVQVLGTHRDHYVRLGAATALGDIKAADGVPALIDALMDKDQLVCTAANDALKSITGQSFPFASDGSRRERQDAQDEWRRWWQDNEALLRAR